MSVLIHPNFARKRITTTPKSLNKHVAALCKQINSSSEPQYIKVNPDPTARAGECYENVRSKVERCGGQIAYGWCIWEWQNVMCEAEHHAVWLDGNRLFDITPQPQGEDKILFLEDSSRQYDFNTRKRYKNRKLRISHLESLKQWHYVADAIRQKIETIEGGDLGALAALQELEDAGRRAYANLIEDLARRTHQKSPCICGSGREFRQCCLPLIRLS